MILRKHYITIATILSALLCACPDVAADRFFQFSNSHINNIYQDSDGYIWICSDYGLSRFDGSNTKTFYHHSSDTTSLISNSVLTVLEDKSGVLWIGTVAGIQSFDRKTEQFSKPRLSYPHVTDFTYVNSIIEDSKGNLWFSTSRSGTICLKNETREPIYYLKTNSNICSNKINTLFEDRFGNIWIGSQDNGVSVLNTDNATLINYSHQPNNPNSLSSNTVFSFAETPDGAILVGTIDGGIDAFNYQTHSFQRQYIPCYDNIFTLKNDRKKNLWIGTDGAGLKYYDFTSGTMANYRTPLPDIDSNHIKVHSVFEDKQGNLWAAIYQKGALLIPAEKNRFYNIGFSPFSPANSIGTECTLSILEDHTGDLWIGTDGDGIYRLNGKDRTIKTHYAGNKLPARSILALYEDSRHTIWAGSYLYGLLRYNAANDSFERIRISKGQTKDGIKDINTIREDNQGNLWIGTNGDGLCIYNPTSGKTEFLNYNLMKNSGQILDNTIQSILFDREGNTWIGTSEAGLSCYNPKNKKFTDYTVANGKLSSNTIFTITEDPSGQIWVGTKQGLNLLKHNGETVVYMEKDGLPNETVYGIETDKSGNLWLSTCFGMSNFIIKEKKFYNYYATDGINNNEFKRGASFRSGNGEIFFGGLNGITSFMPFSNSGQRTLLNLVFTDLYVFNEAVKAGDANGFLDMPLNQTDEIRLPYNANNFSIGYAAIEYNTPEKVTYEVMLENFDDNWQAQPLNTHLTNYTNLKPGKYVFRVKASIAEGPELERSLKIIILPPFWKTWWAKTGYCLLLCLLIYATIRYARQKMRIRKENMEKLNEKRIMESKIQFFTDISHEVRTPLTLILSPIEHLIEKTDDPELLKIYHLIDQNGKRILRLINQIMELRKLDNAEMHLRTTLTDIHNFINNIYSSFSQIAEEKHIEYTLDINGSLPEIWIDRDKADKIIFNVLSNAFKYTPDNGKISVTADNHDGYLRIRIKDSGPGIPEKYHEAIFARFYQVPTEKNRTKLGTGIGLHLSRKLAELHHGSIAVEESSEQGTTFVIRLPIDPSYLKEEEKSLDEAQPNLATMNQPSVADFISTETIQQESKAKKQHTLLIVEDDTDIKNYLSDILHNEYRILTASNGKEGLETTIRELPDCVITDIMMPEMDGTEMCRKIKANAATCDIPVIVLTAKTSIEQRVEGLSVGADSYIPKPFNIEHLRTRISKLIELRRAMRDKYSGKLDVKEEHVKVKSADEKLLEKVEVFVQKELANPDLSVELIASEIGVSRSHLHRKLKQLTNQNPSDYIKNTRLRHAAYLLTNKNIAVSEAGYATGFSSLSHFSNSFKEFYGMSPTKYVEINRGKNIDIAPNQ